MKINFTLIKLVFNHWRRVENGKCRLITLAFLLLAMLLVARTGVGQTNFNWVGTDSGSWADMNNWWLDYNPATYIPGGQGQPDRICYGALSSTNNANGEPVADPLLANVVTNADQTLDQDYTIDSMYLGGVTNAIAINAGASPHTLTIQPGIYYNVHQGTNGYGNALWMTGGGSLLFDTNVTLYFNNAVNWYIAGGPRVNMAGTIDLNGYAWGLTVDSATVEISGSVSNSWSNGNAWQFAPFVYNTGQIIVSGKIYGGSQGISWYQPVPATGLVVTNDGSILPMAGALGNSWDWGSGYITLVDNAVVGTGRDGEPGGNINVGAYGSYTVNVADNAQVLLGSGVLNVENSGVVNQNGGIVGNTTAAEMTLRGTGVYNLNGGVLRNGVGIVGYDSGKFNFNGGALDLGADGQVTASNTTASFIVKAGGVALAFNSGDNYNFNAPLEHDANTTTDGGFWAASGGSVQLNAANTYNGPTVITNGTQLILADSDALQNSTLVKTSAGGGSVQFSGVSTCTLGGLSGDGDLSLPVTLMVGNNNEDTAFSGVLAGSGSSLVKVGSGTLYLSGANTYNGSTMVNGGKLSLSTASAGGGDYTVAGSGVLEAQVVSAGTTLTLPSLSMSAGSSLNLDTGALGNPTAPVINVTGALTPASTVNLNLSGSSLTNGTFTLIKYGSLGGDGIDGFSPHLVLPLGFGGTATLVNNTANHSIDVNITVEAVVNVATSLGISRQPSATATAGVPFLTQPKIAVLDQFGNPLTSATNIITVMVAGGGYLNGSNAPVSLAPVNGVATFSGLFATGAGNIALTFSASGLPSTNSDNILVSPNILSRLIWTTQPGQATNGFVLGQSPVLKTADAYGNLTTTGLSDHKLVQVSVSSGDGILSGTVTNDIGTAAGNGTIAFTNLVLSGMGVNQLVASDVGSLANPTNIVEGTNCQLWLDASDVGTLTLSTNGTNVITWMDKSGKTNDATGGTTPAFVTDSLLTSGALGHGRVVRFYGNGGFAVDLSGLANSPYTIMAVEVAQTKGGSSYLIGNSYGGVDGTLGFGYQTTGEWRWQQYADDLNYDAPFTFPTPRIWSGVMQSDLTQTLYLNSTNVATRTAAALLSGTALSQGFVGGPGNAYVGDMAELIVYNAALSDADRTSLETYLTSKWMGLSGAVSANFTVVSTNGTSGEGPVIETISYNSSSSSIMLSGTGGTANGTYWVLTSTNVAAPLGMWVPVQTNSFDGTGAFSASVPVDSADRSRFYRLSVP